MSRFAFQARLTREDGIARSAEVAWQPGAVTSDAPLAGGLASGDGEPASRAHDLARASRGFLDSYAPDAVREGFAFHG